MCVGNDYMQRTCDCFILQCLNIPFFSVCTVLLSKERKEDKILGCASWIICQFVHNTGTCDRTLCYLRLTLGGRICIHVHGFQRPARCFCSSFLIFGWDIQAFSVQGCHSWRTSRFTEINIRFTEIKQTRPDCKVKEIICPNYSLSADNMKGSEHKTLKGENTSGLS